MSEALDPIRYEILQHRLQSLTDEAAVTMKRVSASPVASSIGDLNSAIMTARGETSIVGLYSISKGSTLASVCRDIIAEYSENPGIEPGDAFLCNDPYVGIMHQNDVALLVPCFVDGKLVAWSGAEIHEVDVGGPTPGQVQLGARDIFGEAPLMPPVKIMRGNVIQRDVEANYLRKSRSPDLCALDLRAKVAACHAMNNGLASIAAEIGTDGLDQLLEHLVVDVERLLRQRLSELRDGSWSHTIFMEAEEGVYRIVITLRKEGDGLTLDFTGTSEQAPAVVNMTLPCVRAWSSGNLASALCWDMPWATGGIERVVHIEAEPGTLVNPTFPAGVSKSTTSIGLLASTALRMVVSKMLLTNPAYRDRAMGSWPGAKAQEEIHGTSQHGRPFAADILDGMAGGGGARIHADGVNTGGLAGSPKISIANVENYEQHYPILYLYRREMADSAGAGTYRGGYGIERAYVVHGADSIPEAVLHCTGYRTPVTTGLGGGHPSATNRFEIKRGTDIITRLAGGELPQSFEALPGNLEVPASMEKTFFGRGDVYRSSSNCGGGTGDPLLREPASVLADIERGLISAPTARTLYGVRLDRDGTSIDETATADERAQALRRRCEMANAPERQCPPVALREVVGWYDYHFRVATGEDGNTYLYRDGESAQPLCPADADPTDYLAWADLSLQAAGPSVDPHYLGEGEFFLRAWYCPHTWRQVDLCVLRYEPAPPNDDHEEHSAESAPALEAAPR